MREFKGIRPKFTDESQTHPARVRQFHWVRGAGADDSEAALFAGREMRIARTASGNSFHLTYMDMIYPSALPNEAEAKAVALDFACSVLLSMLSMIGCKRGFRVIMTDAEGSRRDPVFTAPGHDHARLPSVSSAGESATSA